MQFTTDSLTLVSHMAFIGLFFYLLVHLVDWSKFLKVRSDNIIQIRLLVLLLSIVLGYLMSKFVLEIILLSQSFANLL